MSKKIDYCKVWELHLSGLQGNEIATKLGITSRAVRYILRDRRMKFPAGIEIDAAKALVKRMVRKGESNRVIRQRVWSVFRLKLTLAMIAEFSGVKSRNPAAKPAKLRATAVKGLKKSTTKEVQKKFEAARKPVTAVGVTTKANKKAFKKEVKKLEKRTAPTTKKACKAAKKTGKGTKKCYAVNNLGDMVRTAIRTPIQQRSTRWPFG